jgi:hypothetical protein
MFDGVLARGRVAPAVADEAWLRAMLDAEAALAWARGLPAQVVEGIRAARLDVRELGSLSLGGFSATQLWHAGRIEELREGAVARADAVFRWPLHPWCPEIF